MILSLLLLVFTGVIAFFQYIQGFFSAGLTAIFCVFAAVMAMAYHESLAPYLMKFPEEANALSLVLIYAVAYLVPRLIFDKLVSGNLRFPVTLDKIGAGVCGLVAGLLSTGVVAVAVQTLPFDASIGGFSRQDLQDRPGIAVPGAARNGQSADAAVSGELVGVSIDDPDHAGHVWTRQDELLVGLVKKMSNASSLANGHPFDMAHPDYLNELFGQRLGLVVGAKHVAINGKQPGAKIDLAYAFPAPPAAVDAEISQVRGGEPLPVVDASHAQVVVRVDFSPSLDLSDTDQMLRFGLANVRLVVNNANYTPVGTIVGSHTLLKSRPDDPLIVPLKGNESVDFLFEVDPLALVSSTDPVKGKTTKFPAGSFLEIKRYVQLDLSDIAISPDPAPAIATDSANVLGGVMRKQNVVGTIKGGS